MAFKSDEAHRTKLSGAGIKIKNFFEKLIEWVQSYSPTVLIIVGFVLAVTTFWKVDAKDPKEFGAIVKLLGIAVVGILLPRLITLKFGGAEIGLSGDNGKAISESMLAFEKKISDLREEISHIKKCSTIAEAGPMEEAPAVASEAPRTPPKLPPPTNGSDTQKGRFGGQSSVGGYVLSASFPSKHNGGDLVRVRLQVQCKDKNLTAPVRFYIDETFPKNEFSIRPNSEGVAVLDLMVWGGFTVGAWPEETSDTLLELDLAEIAKAPPVIKSR